MVKKNNTAKNKFPEQVVCPWCNHIDDLDNGIRNDWFTWTSIENHLLYLCWNCTDKVHSSYIASERAKEKQSTQSP